MTDTPMKLELNCTTGEEVLRPYTAEELAQAEIDSLNAQEKEIAFNEEKERLSVLKASAKAKLMAGEPLTSEEADTLVI